MADFQNYERRLSLCLKRIDREEGCPAEDKQLIKDFIFHCQAQGVSPGRLYKLCWTLLSLKRQLPVSFRDATRKEMEQLVARVNVSGRYTANTRSDCKEILKRFYKYVRNGNADKITPFPPEVAWISTEVKRNEQKEPDVLGEDEIKRLITGATSTRDKAFIAVLAEGGFRIGEILSGSIGDAVFDENGVRLTVRGKTGQRTVRLITSAPLLGFYVQEHPLKNDPTAPLWYKFGRTLALVFGDFSFSLMTAQGVYQVEGLSDFLFQIEYVFYMLTLFAHARLIVAPIRPGSLRNDSSGRLARFVKNL